MNQRPREGGVRGASGEDGWGECQQGTYASTMKQEQG